MNLNGLDVNDITTNQTKGIQPMMLYARLLILIIKEKVSLLDTLII